MTREDLLRLADRNMTNGYEAALWEMDVRAALRWAAEQLWAYQRGSEYAAEEYKALQEEVERLRAKPHPDDGRAG